MDVEIYVRSCRRETAGEKFQMRNCRRESTDVEIYVRNISQESVSESKELYLATKI